MEDAEWLIHGSARTIKPLSEPNRVGGFHPAKCRVLVKYMGGPDAFAVAAARRRWTRKECDMRQPATKTRPRIGVIVVATTVLAAYLALLADKTLTGTQWHGQLDHAVNLIPVTGIIDTVTSMSTWDAVVMLGGNALMLGPIAFGLLTTLRWFRPWLVLAGTSALIEVLQLVLSMGRATDIDDVILNAGGGS